MFSLVVQLINLFAITLQSLLNIASITGQTIVVLVTGILSTVTCVARNVATFLEIIYEDNTAIFAEDLPNFANHIILTVDRQWQSVLNGVIEICQAMSVKLTVATENIKYSFEACLTILGEVLYLLKNIIIVLGECAWFILTFIPIHLPQLLKVVFRNVTDCVVDNIIDGYMTLLKITNFLTDVPLESFIGITSAIVIVRLCVHFRESICRQVSLFYYSLIRKLLYFYYVLYNYITDSEVRIISRMAGGQDVRARETSIDSPTNLPNVNEDSENSADALCVICQERQKCVLTLPCRHVCLCTECCMRLYGYQRTCPICRTFIYHSVTVYL